MPEAEDKKAAKGGAKKASEKGADKSGARPAKAAGEAPAKAAKAAKAKADKAEAAPRAEKPAAAPIDVDGYMPRLKKYYEEVVRQKLIEEFGYKNALQVPAIDKIVLNMG